MRQTRHSNTERIEILRLMEQRTSNLQQFASEHGVTVPTLYYWQKNLKPTKVDLGTFVEISQPAPKPSASLTVRHHGIELSFDTLPEAIWLAAFVQSLHA